MRRLIVLVVGLCAVALVAPAAAQQRPGQNAETRREMLRRQIDTRFAARVKQDLGLTDQQTRRLGATLETYQTRRRQLEREERQLKLALGGQLRPGVAADQDSVAALMDGLLRVKEAQIATFRAEMNEMGQYLSPVQQAQFFIYRDRLQERIQQVLEERQADRPRQGVP